jgi:four helix bundle protein
MFSHEKLHVYHKAIDFIVWTQPIIEILPTKLAARDQLDRASTSMPLNIAEGNVKFSIADRARYVQTATGSAVESAACLDVLRAQGKIDTATVEAGKQQLEEMVRMLTGLLHRLGYRFESAQEGLRVREESDPIYGGSRLEDMSGFPLDGN